MLSTVPRAETTGATAPGEEGASAASQPGSGVGATGGSARAPERDRGEARSRSRRADPAVLEVRLTAAILVAVPVACGGLLLGLGLVAAALCYLAVALLVVAAILEHRQRQPHRWGVRPAEPAPARTPSVRDIVPAPRLGGRTTASLAA